MNSVHWAFVAIALITSGWIVSATYVTDEPVLEIPPDILNLIMTLLGYAGIRQGLKTIPALIKNHSEIGS